MFDQSPMKTRTYLTLLGRVATIIDQIVAKDEAASLAINMSVEIILSYDTRTHPTTVTEHTLHFYNITLSLSGHGCRLSWFITYRFVSGRTPTFYDDILDGEPKDYRPNHTQCHLQVAINNF